MKVSKNIEHGDLQGLGLAKIRILRDHGVYTYSDFSKLSVKDVMRLPFFGAEGVSSINEFISGLEDDEIQQVMINESVSSLSKREHFAGLAMQSLIIDVSLQTAEVARMSVEYADALLAELDK